MINSLIKDDVLNLICETEEYYTYILKPLQKTLDDFNLSFNELHAILHQFKKLGFIEYLNLCSYKSEFEISVTLDAFDFKNRGGFFVQEETLKLSLEKLALEVEQLSQTFPEKVLTFSTILANITTCLSFFPVK